MSRLPNAFILLLLLCPLLSAGCAVELDEHGDGHDHGHAHDDPGHGDSLPPGGKADGYTVPGALGLDKDGVVYLTFDDGPSPYLTPRILDTLADHDVSATFFVSGTSLGGNDDILRRQRDEGHIVANHQWVHDVASTGEFRQWVVGTRDRIHDVVGEMPLYFRYPYGAMTPWKETILKAEGYIHGGIGWDIDTLDWDFGRDGRASRPEVPSQYRNDFVGFVVSQTERRGGGVILLHDVQSITADNLDAIITRLKSRGFRFAQLPGLGPVELGEIECPAGYVLRNVGTEGGKFCSDGTDVLGPFTSAMVEQCDSWGGGNACFQERWSESLYLSARGQAACPRGASYDPITHYCVELDDAFGPFPSELVAECIARGGGESACRSARWSRSLLVSLLSQP